MRVWPLTALFVAASAPAAASQQQSAEAQAEIPSAYLQCAQAWRVRLRAIGGGKTAAFGCTGSYLDSLPGSAGSTMEMNEASGNAIAAADRYLAEVLEPEIRDRLTPEAEGLRPSVSRLFMFRNIMRTARLYDEALCELYYDYFSGTLRSVVSNHCTVANRDKLIDDMERLAYALIPE